MPSNGRSAPHTGRSPATPIDMGSPCRRTPLRRQGTASKSVAKLENKARFGGLLEVRDHARGTADRLRRCRYRQLRRAPPGQMPGRQDPLSLAQLIAIPNYKAHPGGEDRSLRLADVPGARRLPFGLPRLGAASAVGAGARRRQVARTDHGDPPAQPRKLRRLPGVAGSAWRGRARRSQAGRAADA